MELLSRLHPRNPQCWKSGGKLERNQQLLEPQVIQADRESRVAIPHRDKGRLVTDHLPWDERKSSPENGDYDFSSPYGGPDNSAEADLIGALSATRAFRRLKDIRFLGALDYFLVARPNGRIKRYTRYQHSLGVAALAKAYLGLRHHTPEQRLLSVAAAMLHDIGHPPFSHTLEPVFKEAFGLDHHVATERLITGLAPQGSQIVTVLRSFGVDPLAILHLLNGGDELYDGLFSGPINFDTIEGILRARNYLGMQKLGLTPLKVMKAAATRSDPDSKVTVDAFWQSKREVYALVIRSKLGVFYDGLFQAIARRQKEKLTTTDFYTTESSMFKKMPLLRHALNSERLPEIARRFLPNELPYQFRDFYVDEGANFDSQHDSKRYRQQKTGSSLTVRDFLRV